MPRNIHKHSPNLRIEVAPGTKESDSKGSWGLKVALAIIAGLFAIIAVLLSIWNDTKLKVEEFREQDRKYVQELIRQESLKAASLESTIWQLDMQKKEIDKLKNSGGLSAEQIASYNQRSDKITAEKKQAESELEQVKENLKQASKKLEDIENGIGVSADEIIGEFRKIENNFTETKKQLRIAQDMYWSLYLRPYGDMRIYYLSDLEVKLYPKLDTILDNEMRIGDTNRAPDIDIHVFIGNREIGHARLDEDTIPNRSPASFDVSFPISGYISNTPVLLMISDYDHNKGTYELVGRVAINNPNLGSATEYIYPIAGSKYSDAVGEVNFNIRN